MPPRAEAWPLPTVVRGARPARARSRSVSRRSGARRPACGRSHVDAHAPSDGLETARPRSGHPSSLWPASAKPQPGAASGDGRRRQPYRDAPAGQPACRFPMMLPLPRGRRRRGPRSSFVRQRATRCRPLHRQECLIHEPNSILNAALNRRQWCRSFPRHSRGACGHASRAEWWECAERARRCHAWMTHLPGSPTLSPTRWRSSMLTMMSVSFARCSSTGTPRLIR